METDIQKLERLDKKTKELDDRAVWHWKHFEDELARVEGKRAEGIARQMLAWALGLGIMAIGVGITVGTITLAMRDGAGWSAGQVMLASIMACISGALLIPAGAYVMLVLCIVTYP